MKSLVIFPRVKTLVVKKFFLNSKLNPFWGSLIQPINEFIIVIDRNKSLAGRSNLSWVLGSCRGHLVAMGAESQEPRQAVSRPWQEREESSLGGLMALPKHL